MNRQAHAQLVATIDYTSRGNFSEFPHLGFSDPEIAGTWTIGTESAITLPAVSGNVVAHLSLLVQGFICEGLVESQSMTVIVNGTKLGTRTVTAAEWTDLEFEVPPSTFDQPGPVHINIIHDTPMSPMATGQSSDIRLISFMFHRLELWTSEPLEHCTSSPTQTPHAHTAPDAVEAEVHSGLDGWLFLTGGTNTVLRYYQDPTYFDDAQAARWANLLAGRAKRLQQMGVRYLHIAAPDKISVYPELVTLSLPNLARHPIAMLASLLRDRGQEDLLINPLPIFRERADRSHLYLKTDTHWTYLAGQIVLEMVAGRLGYHRRLDIHGRTKTYYTHVWDLGSKVSPPVSEQNFAVVTNPNVRQLYENDLARAFLENIRIGKSVTHRSIYVAFENNEQNAIDQVAVVFGDSFMDFQDSNTTSIFSENFRELHFVWSPSIDYDFIQKVGANVVITELAERFMISMPDDQYTVAL
jgi:SGNH hydrolase-like domain, acetyltransferase AlgX